MMKMFILTIAFCFLYAHAGVKPHCSLVAKKCLSKAEISGQTFVFPESVTEINNQGVSFCVDSKSTTLESRPAILYIMDQSSSMRNDGDPHGVRGESEREAIKRQKELYPGTAVGHIDFSREASGWDNTANKNYYSKEIRPLSDEKHFDNLMSNIKNVNSSGTNYVAALTKARELLKDFDDDTYTPYVIFITDGLPSNMRSEIFALLNDFPQMHTFFLGDDLNAGNGYAESDVKDAEEMLISMAQKTGGAFHHIKTSNAQALGDTLEVVIDYIFENITIPIKSVALELENSEETIEATTTAIFKSENDLWTAHFNKALTLEPGDNDVEFQVEFANESPEKFSFSIEIEEDNFDARIDSDLWELDCGEGSANGPAIDITIINPIVDYSDDKIKDKLDRYASDSDRKRDTDSAPLNVYHLGEDYTIKELTQTSDDTYDVPNGYTLDDTTDIIGPGFYIDLSLPELQVIQTEDVGDPEWDVSLTLAVRYYDTHGQFIKALNRTVTPDLDLFQNNTIEERFYFEWAPDIVDDQALLMSESGRVLPTGVIIAVVHYSAQFSLKDDYNGFKEGFSSVQEDDRLYKFGFIRPKK